MKDSTKLRRIAFDVGIRVKQILDIKVDGWTIYMYAHVDAIKRVNESTYLVTLFVGRYPYNQIDENKLRYETKKVISAMTAFPQLPEIHWDTSGQYERVKKPDVIELFYDVERLIDYK